MNTSQLTFQQNQQEVLFEGKLCEMSTATFMGKTDLIPVIRSKLVQALITGDWTQIVEMNGFKLSPNFNKDKTEKYKDVNDITLGERFAVLVTDEYVYVGKAKARGEKVSENADIVTTLGKKKSNLFNIKNSSNGNAYDCIEYPSSSQQYKNLMYVSYLFMNEYLESIWKMKAGDLAMKLNNRSVNLIETFGFLGLKFLTKMINFYVKNTKTTTDSAKKQAIIESTRVYFKQFAMLTKYVILCHNPVAFKYCKPLNEEKFQEYLTKGYQSIYKFKNELVTAHSTPEGDESYPIMGFGTMRWERKEKDKAVSKSDCLLTTDPALSELSKDIDLFNYDL